MTAGGRCPLCAGRALEPTGRTLRFPGGVVCGYETACGFCGLLLPLGADMGATASHLREALEASRFVPDPDAPYGMDAYTLRSAATLLRRGAVPLDGAQAAALRAPHSDLAGAALLLDLGAMAGPAITLGAICRAAEAEALAERLAVHMDWAAAIVILADAPERPASTTTNGRVRITARPMAGDFAAQRNALQDLAEAPWVLQLDSDEGIEPAEARLLPALAAMAERDGVLSIGLARRNLVDGTLSDLYPDTQYRLNRRTVRFSGLVHERPVRAWQQSLLAPGFAIRHDLGRAHVETRSRTYERLLPGGGRGDEADALLQPYRS